MLAIEAVRYQFSLRVQLINHPISIFLHTGSKYYNLIVLCHFSQKPMAKRPYQEKRIISLPLLKTLLPTHIHIMNQRLVQIQHQRVPRPFEEFALVERWQIWCVDYGQLEQLHLHWGQLFLGFLRIS